MEQFTTPLQGGSLLSLFIITRLDHFFIMPRPCSLQWQSLKCFQILILYYMLAFLCKDQQGSVTKKCFFFPFRLKEIGYTHMRIVEGVNSLLQLSGLLARMCSKVTSQDSWVTRLVAINRWTQARDWFSSEFQKQWSWNENSKQRARCAGFSLLSVIVTFMNSPCLIHSLWVCISFFLR